MLRISNLVGLLCFAFWTWAQSEPLADNDLQALVDEAVRMNISAPPRETLDYLDSIQDQMEAASSRQLAQLSLIKARSHALMADNDLALDILEGLLAEELAPEQRLRALSLAANLAMHVDNYVKGFDYLNQGLVLQESVDDPGLKSDIFGLATYWHFQLGDPGKGLEFGFRTLELAKESGDIRELCVALEKLGQAKEMNGLYEQALEKYQAGLEACEKAEDPVFIAAMHALIGRLLLRMENLEEAEPWLKQGIEMSATSGFKDGATDTMTTYGELLLEQERYDEAYALLRQVLERTQSGGRPINYSDAHYMLARIKHNEEDYRAAWEHLYEHLQARESNFDVERARLIAFHEVQFDLRSREQEIELLREQARVSRLEEAARMQERRLEQVATIMGAFILVLLVLFLIRAIRQRHYFRHLSAHDGLTGLLNHSHFIETAKSQVEECARQGQDLTLLLADIDYFKLFNDRHGHQAGDAVLRKAAQCFDKALSRHGVVGRIGGEEFAACLPAMDMTSATALVEQIRETLRSCRLSDIDETVTMSFGIAQLQPSEAFDSLRARADSALYQAKHAGRDRTVMADSPLQ